MDNQHSQAVPAATLAAVQAKIGEAAALLKPYLVSLTPDERHDRLKLGDKSLAFGEKAFDYATAHPQLCPSYLDMGMFGEDMKDATGLRALEISLRQLLQGVDDTVMVAGGEAYSQALVFYSAVKEAARQDIPGAKAIYDDLRTRFPGRPRKAE
jgi:hypothetical protein